MQFTPHTYQQRAIDFVIGHPFCALFLGCGLGKSAITLTALRALREDYLEIERTLVIAPKSVAENTWTGECEKWDHLRGTRVSVIMGSATQRLRALDADADLYVINRENVTWLVEHLAKARKAWPFDCVVVDESSSFKNFQSKRFKRLFSMRPYFRRCILLTGTPSPNGLEDLWAQVKLLDKGERLGRFIGQYRTRYFHPGAHNGSVVYQYIPNTGAREEITARLADICLSMQASDYLSMPALMDGGVTIRLPEMKAYESFRKECLMDIGDTEIVAATAVALTNKLLQFSSGAVYDDEHDWHEVSTAKLDALDDILESAGGDPVLVYYNFQSEKERILARHPEAVPFKGEPEILRQWNLGEIRVLLAHPASVAYGLNMQQGGHIIVWFSPTWNLELYQQANARLHRQGQTRPVILYHIICRGTMDERVMLALRNKDDVQTSILTEIKKYLTKGQKAHE